MDDSCVSEDNVSSANSSSDQGINVYQNSSSSDVSPIAFAINNNNNNNTMNKNRNYQPQIIHLSPGGTTVIEYKTANLQSKITAALHQSGANVTTSTTAISRNSSSELNSPVITSSSNVPAATSTTSGGGGSSTSKTSSSAVHQHFHKKYLREEHNKSLNQQSSPLPSPAKLQPETFR